MKNLILTIALFSLCINVNTQNKNTKIQAKKNAIASITNKPTINNGLKVANFKDLSPSGLNGLNVPKATISVAQFNARAVKSWKISPIKQFDDNLKLESFHGTWRRGAWITTGEIQDYASLEESRRLSNEGFQINANLSLFPLSLGFAVTTGAEYRLKIKFYGSGSALNKSNSVYIAINTVVSKVDLNIHGEVNHIFIAQDSRPVDIHISMLTENKRFDRTSYREIQIDRIDN